MDSRQDEKEPEVAGTRTRRFLFSWSALLMLAFLIYEFSSQASLGIVVLCCKFGWEDFQTAWWLQKRDEYPSRARACFLPN